MKSIKLVITLVFIFSNGVSCYASKKMTTGKKVYFEKIIRKFEDHLYRNYYTDSIQPIRFHEYTYVDSSRHLLNAVFIEAPNKPVWRLDFQYCLKHYGKNYAMQPRYWNAMLYEKYPNERYGCITFSGKGWYITPFWDYEQNALCQHVWSIQERRLKECESRKSDFEEAWSGLGKLAYKIDKTFDTPGDSWEDFSVSDTVFEGEECYRLVRRYKGQMIYGEKERAKLLTMQLESLTGTTREEQAEFLRLADFWGNRISSGFVERIINKKDYALLQLTICDSIDNDKGVKVLCEYTVDRFAKANGVYQQILYKSKILRYVSGSAFRNTDNVYTYIVKLPMEKNYPEEALKSIPGKLHHLAEGYEVFCTRLTQPTEEMLQQWKAIEQECLKE